MYIQICLSFALSLVLTVAVNHLRYQDDPRRADFVETANHLIDQIVDSDTGGNRGRLFQLFDAAADKFRYPSFLFVNNVLAKGNWN